MAPYRHAREWWSGTRLFLLLLALWAPAPAAAQAPPAQPVAAPPLTVTAQTPESGKLILERRPAITVTFQDPQQAVDPKSVTMEVDGADVTLFLKVEPGKVTYVPASDLAPGEHTVKLAAADKTGAAIQPVEWKFKIRRFAAVEEASLEGDVSASFERALRKPKKEPKDDSGVSKKTETPLNLFSGNLRVDGLLKEGDFTAKLNSNVRYVDEFRPRARPKNDNDKLALANYLLRLDRKPLAFEAGDLVVNEGFFGAPNLARRGMQLQADAMEEQGLKFNMFGTRYETIKGHDPFLGVEEDKESLLWGGALTWAPLPRKCASLT